VISSVGAHARNWEPGLIPFDPCLRFDKRRIRDSCQELGSILGPRYPRKCVAPVVIDTDMSNFTKTEAGREAALGCKH